MGTRPLVADAITSFYAKLKKKKVITKDDSKIY